MRKNAAHASPAQAPENNTSAVTSVKRSEPVPQKPQASQRLSPQPRQSVPDWCIYAGLLVTTLIVFWQVRGFDFITLDDLSTEWVLGPLTRRGITLAGLWWALTSGAEAWWFPVTRFSHMLDVQLFGVNAGAHHFTSVLLHAASTLLLFAFMKRATRELWPSAFVAFVFALHPLHVESVVWVAERKDVLCAFFWMLTLCAYLRYTEKPGAGRYAAVMAFLCLSLMSKSMAVSLPFVLILVDYWPLRRKITLSASVKEKLPFFLAAAAVGVVTVICARLGGSNNDAFPRELRIENALVSYVRYLGKMFWPADLAVFYPYPASIPLWQAALSGLALAAVTALLWRLRRFRYLLIGWLWFLITMAPVSGVVQSGFQAWADRYMYIPMIGLSAMLAWGAVDLLGRWKQATGLVAVLAGAACMAMAAVSYHQLAYWKNTETLFTHALAVTDRNYMAHLQLGTYYMNDPSRALQAIDEFQKSILYEPKNEIANNDLGMVLLGFPDRLDEARQHLETAVRLNPNYYAARNNLAAALMRTPGRMPDAVAQFQAAVRIMPNASEAHYNLGAVLAGIPGRLPEAIAQYQAALAINPDYDAHYALALALLQYPERRVEAQRHLIAALRLRPGDPQTIRLLRQLSGRGPAN